MANGSGGIEEVLYVEDLFRKTTVQLNIITGENLFIAFEEIITDVAEEKCGNTMANLIAGQRNANNPNRFNSTMKLY